MPIDTMYERDPSSVRSILKSLPDWFGDPDAIDTYEHDAGSDAFQSLLAVDSGRTVGVALVRRHFPEAAELHLTPSRPTYVAAVLAAHWSSALPLTSLMMGTTSCPCTQLDRRSIASHMQRRGSSTKRPGFTPWRSTTAWTGPALL